MRYLIICLLLTGCVAGPSGYTVRDNYGRVEGSVTQERNGAVIRDKYGARKGTIENGVIRDNYGRRKGTIE